MNCFQRQEILWFLRSQFRISFLAWPTMPSRTILLRPMASAVSDVSGLGLRHSPQRRSLAAHTARAAAANTSQGLSDSATGVPRWHFRWTGGFPPLVKLCLIPKEGNIHRSWILCWTELGLTYLAPCLWSGVGGSWTLKNDRMLVTGWPCRVFCCEHINLMKNWTTQKTMRNQNNIARCKWDCSGSTSHKQLKDERSTCDIP